MIRKTNTVLTLMRRDDVLSTLIRRYFDAMYLVGNMFLLLKFVDLEER